MYICVLDYYNCLRLPSVTTNYNSSSCLYVTVMWWKDIRTRIACTYATPEQHQQSNNILFYDIIQFALAPEPPYFSFAFDTCSNPDCAAVFDSSILFSI
jgi:hypothetical protein